jgi:hypothetical protein
MQGWVVRLALSMNEDDPLEDFNRRKITLDRVTKRVYVAGYILPESVLCSSSVISSRLTRAEREGRATSGILG